MQGMTKLKVFVMFDSQCCTWNVMGANRECLFFGSAEDVDDWLIENKDSHEECTEREVMSRPLNNAA